jgi:hypothetical protein
MNTVSDILRLTNCLEAFHAVRAEVASPTRLLRSFINAVKNIIKYIKSLRFFGLSVIRFVEPQSRYIAIDRNCREHAVAETLRLIFLNSFLFSLAKRSLKFGMGLRLGMRKLLVNDEDGRLAGEFSFSAPLMLP